MTRRTALRGFALGGVGLIAVACGGGPVDDFVRGTGITLPNPFRIGPNLAGKIAFVRGTDVLVWESGGTKVVATGQSFADPSWSPDGTRLAVVVGGTNHSDVGVLDRAGRLVTQLTHDLSNVLIQDSVWARKPVWSPDATRVAYVTDREKHDMSLWVVDVGSGKPEPLVLEKRYSWGLDWPTWSPNGAQIAYTAFDNGASEIRVVDLKSRQERALLKESRGALDPAWSPNGNYVAYVRRSADGDDLVVLSLLDGRKDQLTHGMTCRGPTWSRTGDALVFVALTRETFALHALSVSYRDGVEADTPVQLTAAVDVAAPSGVSWTS